MTLAGFCREALDSALTAAFVIVRNGPYLSRKGSSMVLNSDHLGIVGACKGYEQKSGAFYEIAGRDIGALEAGFDGDNIEPGMSLENFALGRELATEYAAT